MISQNEKQNIKMDVKAGVRAGFWVAFGAGLGGLQIIPQGEAPKTTSPVLPTSSSISVPVEPGK